MCSIVPLGQIGGGREHALEGEAPIPSREQARALAPVAFNALLIGMGAGLDPFMNLYFKDRFGCSSAKIGTIFSIADLHRDRLAARPRDRAPVRQAAHRDREPAAVAAVPRHARRRAPARGGGRVVLGARHAHAGVHPARADVHHGGDAAAAALARDEHDQPGLEHRLGRERGRRRTHHRKFGFATPFPRRVSTASPRSRSGARTTACPSRAAKCA